MTMQTECEWVVVVSDCYASLFGPDVGQLGVICLACKHPGQI